MNNNKYLCVMFRLKEEEVNELNIRLKELKLSRRMFILKWLRGEL